MRIISAHIQFIYKTYKKTDVFISEDVPKGVGQLFRGWGRGGKREQRGDGWDACACCNSNSNSSRLRRGVTNICCHSSIEREECSSLLEVYQTTNPLEKRTTVAKTHSTAIKWIRRDPACSSVQCVVTVRKYGNVSIGDKKNFLMASTFLLPMLSSIDGIAKFHRIL